MNLVRICLVVSGLSPSRHACAHFRLRAAYCRSLETSFPEQWDDHGTERSEHVTIRTHLNLMNTLVTGRIKGAGY